jgi:hypothetical protein
MPSVMKIFCLLHVVLRGTGVSARQPVHSELPAQLMGVSNSTHRLHRIKKDEAVLADISMLQNALAELPGGSASHGFLARPLEAHADALAVGIADDSPGVAPLTTGRPARGVTPREFLTDTVRLWMAVGSLTVGVAALAGGKGRSSERALAEDPGGPSLCILQAAAATLALLLVAETYKHPEPWLRGLLLLADAVAHAAMLIRGVLSFVEAKHTIAAHQFRKRLVVWSVWLDTRAHMSFVIAAVAWCSTSIAMVLFVMVSMGGHSVYPWAWWVNHAVLGLTVLAVSCSQEDRHEALSPRVLLAANVAAGFAHRGPISGAPAADAALLIIPLLQLLDAIRGYYCLKDAATSEDPAKGGYHCGGDSRLLDRQLVCTLTGNQDTSDFERHLVEERRVCYFYAFQDLLACEAATSHAEMKEKYLVWRALFTNDRAPLRVTIPQDSPEKENDLCPQASVHRTKQALMGTLRASHARFLIRKRRSLSAGNSPQSSPRSFLTAMRIPGCSGPNRPLTVV